MMSLEFDPGLTAQFLEYLPASVWATDANHRFVYFNRLGASFHAVGGKPPLGESWLSLVHSDDRPLVGGLVERRIRQNIPCVVEFRLVRGPGRHRWVQAQIKPLFDDFRNFSGLIAIVREITRGPTADAGMTKAPRHTPVDYDEALGLEDELRDAIGAGQLMLLYQPKLRLPDMALLGFEALVRWPHPVRGLLEPASFIGLAEESHLIRPLTRWVFEAAARQLRRWLDAGLDPKPVAVNISPSEFMDGLLQTHLPAYRDFAVPDRLLEIEITEHAMIENWREAAAIVAALKLQGIKVAMDDFGAGYSSLAQLRRLPITTLKIDRALTRDVHRNAASRAVAAGIISIARELGLEIVAEGVESDSQLETLQDMDCTIVQGYLTGRPMPAEEATGFLLRLEDQRAAEGALVD